MTEPASWTTPPPPIERTCVLCGETSPRVTHALIRWRQDPDSDLPAYGSGPRCLDAEACWRRVMDLGDEWLVDDGRPARLVPVHPPAADVDELDFGEPPEEASA